ncbi:hypothetical protein AXX17_AT2G32140 [Arabidopsis thaliana]|uniref:Serpin domain-containing protein n=1 Tax=Arabidopsis thaliana TaxID=3702 RepID=A0A178VXL9_ARATH|nr:hypothetical protein AXX17_AT2G32140 [Arabidopsis thaliana]
MDLKESVNDQYDILENLKGSVGNLNDIILRLTQHVIASTAGKTSNLVFSPALLSVILSFVAASSPDELNAVSSGIVTTILADSTPSGGPTISAANGVWIEKTLYVEPSFKDLLLNSYKAAFNQVDFRTKADEVNKEVNSWVEEQTNGLITDLLPPNSASSWTDLIFANALFFNGRWDSQFNPSLTKESDFHLLDGTKVRVPFMTGAHEDSLDVYEGFKVLNLPYREGREDSRGFSMQIYLPDEKDGLPAVSHLVLTPAMLERLASTRGFLNGKEDIPSHWADVGELKIPRFKFDFGFEASEALKGLGLEVPSTIIHKSCIEVDEVGSKAAAAAVIFVGCCGPAEKRYDFVADHPFLFLVKEYRSGLILFLGQVMDPSKH